MGWSAERASAGTRQHKSAERLRVISDILTEYGAHKDDGQTAIVLLNCAASVEVSVVWVRSGAGRGRVAIGLMLWLLPG